MKNPRLNQIQDWPKLAREAKWSASALAKQCGVSVRTLHRHFLKHLGKNTKTWLSAQRQQSAHELICSGFSVKETADGLGYKSPSNFTRHFKHETGICPSQQPPSIATSRPKLSANEWLLAFTTHCHRVEIAHAIRELN